MEILCTGSACSTDSATIAMPGLVKGYNFLLFRIHYPVFFLQPTTTRSIASSNSVRPYRSLFSEPPTGPPQLTYVGQISSHKTRSEIHLAQITSAAHTTMLAMNFQDGFPPVDIRPIDQDLPSNRPGAATRGSNIPPCW